MPQAEIRRHDHEHFGGRLETLGGLRKIFQNTSLCVFDQAERPGDVQQILIRAKAEKIAAPMVREILDIVHQYEGLVTSIERLLIWNL